MNGTKLKQLEKPDLLSNWQKQQKEKRHYNPEMYLKRQEIDPWALGRMETEIIKQNIPALAKLQFGFSARHRNNKEMNQIINNQKMMEKAKLFHKK